MRWYGVQIIQQFLGGAGADEVKLDFSLITLNIPIVEPSTAVALEYVQLLKDHPPFLYTCHSAMECLLPSLMELLIFSKLLPEIISQNIPR